MKKIITIILLLTMLCGLNTNVSAYSGTGTESNPYVITTPDELMNMKNDLSAHYILGNSIDMSGVWYEPVGNEIDGAFTGSLDGRGYTIRNLDLDLEGSKYVGLFGYLDGTVKNVNLTNVVASGYKYVGGIAGYADENSVINNCYISGDFTVNYITDTIRVGGAVGQNKGSIKNCENTTYISTNNIACFGGGIAGENFNGNIINNVNRGTIENNSEYSGGIIGIDEGGLIQGCINYADYVEAGIVAYKNYGEIKNCVNYGNVTSGISNYVGSGTISLCINAGKAGVGIVKTTSNSTISKCFNSGETSFGIVDSGDTVENCINTGKYSNVGLVYYNHLSTYSNSSDFLNRCINVGFNNAGKSIETGSWYHSGSYGGSYIHDNNGGYLYSHYSFGGNFNYLDSELKEKDTYDALDFDYIWLIDSERNSGYPQLRNLPKHIILNESVLVLSKLETSKLKAYIDSATENVTWTSSDESVATVSPQGVVKGIGFGVCTITATNSEGMKANCCVNVYDKAETMSFEQEEYSVSIHNNVFPNIIQSPNNTFEDVYWESDNPNIAAVYKFGQSEYYNDTAVVTGIKSGIATITATTINGKIVASCKVKVIGHPVTALTLSKTNANINKDDNLQLTVSVNPSDYEGQITWKSSDESIATVDNNGLVTAKYPGIANIYAQAESGVTTQCTVTVKAPATEIKLNKSELTLQTGYTEKLLPAMMPEYTTDIVSWASSNPSYASVSADGTVTAKAVGQVIITATTTSGEKAHCTVNIVNPPIPVASVTLDKTQLIMTKADTAQLNATVLPDNATDKNLIWASSDESVATVNSTGVVTAVGSGNAIISVTSANGYYHECSVQVIAANGASFVATSTKAMPGDIAEYTVSVVKNPGMSYYKLSLKYDNMLLEPIEIINKNTSGSFSHNLADDEKTGLNLMWFSQSDNAENTDLFTIRFRVSDYAKLGEEIPIAMSYGESDIKNSSGNKLAFFLSDASIAVEEPLPGDVNEDGEIDSFDITALSRGVAEIEKLTARQMIAADVNDDNVVDIKDNVKLLQYVVGWSGVELMSIENDEPTINVSSAKVNEAGEADINVSVKGNTGFSGFKFVIEYNPEEVEILSVTPNENILPERFLTNFGLSDKLVVTWYNTNDINSNGTLFTLRVKTKDGFNGEYSPISIAYADNNICDDKLENVDFFYNEGYVMTDDYIVLKEYISDTEYACVLKFAEVQKEQDAKAIIAFYDENGKFVQLASSDITVNPDMVEIYTDFDKKAYSTYKLMIWESFDNLKPIVKAK